MWNVPMQRMFHWDLKDRKVKIRFYFLLSLLWDLNCVDHKWICMIHVIHKNILFQLICLRFKTASYVTDEMQWLKRVSWTKWWKICMIKIYPKGEEKLWLHCSYLIINLHYICICMKNISRASVCSVWHPWVLYDYSISLLF